MKLSGGLDAGGDCRESVESGEIIELEPQEALERSVRRCGHWDLVCEGVRRDDEQLSAGRIRVKRHRKGRSPQQYRGKGQSDRQRRPQTQQSKEKHPQLGRALSVGVQSSSRYWLVVHSWMTPSNA